MSDKLLYMSDIVISYSSWSLFAESQVYGLCAPMKEQTKRIIGLFMRNLDPPTSYLKEK